MRNERTAIRLAMSLVNRDWNGQDDFSRGMRILKMSMARQAVKARLDKLKKSDNIKGDDKSRP